MLVTTQPDWPPALQELSRSHPVDVQTFRSSRDACEPSALARCDGIIIHDPSDETATDDLTEQHLLAEALSGARIMGIILSSGTAGVVPEDDASLPWIRLPENVSADELWGRISTICQYHPLLRRMDEHVSAMQRLGKKLNQHFVEVDQELRLASRLQRDFLPKSLPEVNDIRFAALYRPATWVSGDVYDVRRLTEDTIAFYLADAVGHGVAAGLLTMFLRQSIVGKRIANANYHIVPPHEVLETLNRDLVRQELPNCQFVTGLYGTINTRTHELVYARGGHPHPIHVSADGQCVESRVIGGLLGIFDEEEFGYTRLTLEPGQKFIIYSDGIEDMILCRRQRDTGPTEFKSEFLDLVTLPAQECISSITARLDQEEGSLTQLDDQTCLIIERLPE